MYQTECESLSYANHLGLQPVPSGCQMVDPYGCHTSQMLTAHIH